MGAADTVRDEIFWRAQEKRRRELGQPCCTQSNMSKALYHLRGNFSVVIHGEHDCLNCFFHHVGPRGVDFFSSRLTERDLVMGTTGPPLRKLLNLLSTKRKAEVVIVLGTCPVEVAYDPFESVVEEVSDQTGVPMIALRTHGLSLMNQSECQDWLYASLAGLPQLGGPRRTGSVSLIGLPPDLGELEDLLAAMGLSLGAAYPQSATLEDWRRIGNSDHCFVVDQSMYGGLTEVLRGYGSEVSEVPLPIGLGPTRSFYTALARAAGGMNPAAQEILDGHVAVLLEPMARTRERVAGKRLAYCVRMLNTARADKLAYSGLGEAEFLRDLGFELEILVQGPPEEEAREQYARRIAALGFGDLPMRVFGGPAWLGEQLRDGAFDLALVGDFARNVVESEGIPLLTSGDFVPFFAGMRHNLARLDAVAEAWS